MKKVKKILLIAGIGLLVLIVVAVIVVGLFLGKIVKTGIETVGPKITQTTLTVDAVDVSLLTGSAKVKNLVIGNPAGLPGAQRHQRRPGRRQRQPDVGVVGQNRRQVHPG